MRAETDGTHIKWQNPASNGAGGIVVDMGLNIYAKETMQFDMTILDDFDQRFIASKKYLIADITREAAMLLRERLTLFIDGGSTGD